MADLMMHSAVLAQAGCNWTGTLSAATLLSVIGELLALFIVLRILTERRDAAATFAWIFGLILLPYVGALLYFLLAGKVERRRIRRRDRAVARLGQHQVDMARHLRRHRERSLQDVNPAQQGIMRLAEELGAGHPTVGNRVRVLDTGRQTFEAIESAIRNAKSHIHLEYYIFRPDETGRHLLSLLEKKARDGVEVRLLYDSVGSSFLKRRHLKKLLSAGGRAEPFLPLFSWRRPFSVNFRTHRKIIVVDDHIGFVGGRNVGNEYRSDRAEYGEWRDIHMKLEGPSVYRLQEVFAEDWIFASGEDLSALEHCFTPFERPGRARVQVMDSGPDGQPEIIHRILFEAIVSARRSVDIITPYFVPDAAIVMALQNAAYRAVRVRLLVPGRTDSRITGWAARSYYPEILKAGVEVYSFSPGMHHAKVVVVDDRWSYVGTANMDIRSFRLNFEVGVALYEPDIARRIISFLERDIKRSERLLPLEPGRIEALANGVGRALSPIL